LYVQGPGYVVIRALPLDSHWVVLGAVLTHCGIASAGEADSNTPMPKASTDTTARVEFVAMTCSDRRQQFYAWSCRKA
jgi:hypothetical protein